MGNTTSNTNHNRPAPIPSRRVDSPSRHAAQRRAQSPSPGSSSPNQPHRSLRTKKKSLELPDLASLSLTPASSHHNSSNSSPLSHYRRPPRTSSPIPIPIPVSNTAQINNASNTGTSPRGRPLNVKNAADNSNRVNNNNYSADVLLDQPPSTHIPVHHHHRGRGNPYFRGAPLQYSSTHSFTTRGHSSSRQPQHSRMQEIYPDHEQEHDDHQIQPVFLPETVHSTIPIALIKAEEEIAALADAEPDLDENGQPVPKRAGTTTPKPFEEPKEPVNVKITWRGGGKNVVLARAGDNNWKGRVPMEPDNPPADTTWTTWVSLMPGTHHIRFIVDDQWRVADDLPTAVDDEGSLANYVAVPISGFTPPSTSAAQVQVNISVPSSPPAFVPAVSQTPGKQYAAHAHSFWSTTTSSAQGSVTDAPSNDASGDGGWTQELPAALIAAAREEEAYLAYTAASEYDQHGDYQGYSGGYGGGKEVPAPNIPPAPVLPRHLDKLILNVKVGQVTRGREREREREREAREREREREREGRRKQGRSLLGMTSTVANSLSNPQPTNDAPPLPITTASGTDVTTAHLTSGAAHTQSNSTSTHTRLGLDGPGLADDASVLPVPSHVVLHHLSTSAIRNGVLAVGNTTRYRKKYLTTIYYKPT